jgi:hypothetical protein
MNLPERIGEGGFCQCGAFGQIHRLSGASLFMEDAKRSLGIDTAGPRRGIEVVDGGVVFEEKGEPVIIQWAKRPQ